MTYEHRLARFAPLLGTLCVSAAFLASCGNPPPMPPPSDTGPVDVGFTIPDGSVRCRTNADCDDHVMCTRDSCLPGLMICAHSTNDALCDDGIFCSGRSMCDLVRDCVRVTTHTTCDDGNVCTIDRCDEMMRTCEHAPRDLDVDGDPDFNCPRGTDCDDRDPLRSGIQPELCDDMIDNDCDGTVDERPCGRPAHDTCMDPLPITMSGRTLLMLSGASPDYTLSCVGGPRPDLVVSLTLTQPQDVRISAQGDLAIASIGMRTNCTDATSETACSQSYPAVIRRRALPAGTYYLIVQGSGMVALDVALTPPTMPPTNTSCGAPTVIPPTGGRFTGNFVDVRSSVGTSCGAGPGLVYQLVLPSSSDLHVTLSSPDGQQMSWAVQTTCGSSTGQLRCMQGAPADATLHQVPAGTYFIVIQGPSFLAVDYALTVTVGPPTPRVHGDLCSDPILLTLGTPYVGTMARAEDDYMTTCGYNYPDLVHTFTLAADSDVDITVDGGTAFMNAAVRQTCASEFPQLRCDTGAPVLSHIRGLSAGVYFVIVEAARAGAYTITVRATTPPTIAMPVTGNDGCGGAVVIPQTGGFWSGTTIGNHNNYDPVMCGGGAASPALDAAFRLDLAARSRVYATTDGSTFDTLLYRMVNVCRSGTEVVCNDDSGGRVTSTLTDVLNPGTYFYIVDGFGSFAQGPYQFQAIITPAP